MTRLSSDVFIGHPKTTLPPISEMLSNVPNVLGSIFDSRSQPSYSMSPTPTSWNAAVLPINPTQQFFGLQSPTIPDIIQYPNQGGDNSDRGRWISETPSTTRRSSTISNASTIGSYQANLGIITPASSTRSNSPDIRVDVDSLSHDTSNYEYALNAELQKYPTIQDAFQEIMAEYTNGRKKHTTAEQRRRYHAALFIAVTETLVPPETMRLCNEHAPEIAGKTRNDNEVTAKNSIAFHACVQMKYETELRDKWRRNIESLATQGPTLSLASLQDLVKEMNQFDEALMIKVIHKLQAGFHSQEKTDAEFEADARVKYENKVLTKLLVDKYDKKKLKKCKDQVKMRMGGSKADHGLLSPRARASRVSKPETPQFEASAFEMRSRL